MISLKLVSDYVFNNFENVTVSKHNTHFHTRCALCGDSKKNRRKKRFHLDWKNGNPVFQCWNCGESGSFVRLYALMNSMTEEEAKKAIFSNINVSEFEYSHSGGMHQSPIKINWVSLSPFIQPASDVPKYNWILDDCASENLYVESQRYMSWVEFLNRFRMERHIPKNIELLYAWRGVYEGRIIIPVRDSEENIIYFQARRRSDEDDSVIKYKNPLTEKSQIILNKHKFDPEKSILVTEGLIDAFMIGDQGTTMLGKELHMDFLKELYMLTKKYVIIVFDNDEEGQKSLRKYLNIFTHARLRYFLMPKNNIDSKDINKLKIDHGIEDVYDFIVENSFTRARCNVLLALGR